MSSWVQQVVGKRGTKIKRGVLDRERERERERKKDKKIKINHKASKSNRGLGGLVLGGGEGRKLVTFKY